mgnify:CR=1 FL=1
MDDFDDEVGEGRIGPSRRREWAIAVGVVLVGIVLFILVEKYY